MLQSIKVLLLHGADVSVKDMDGMTPSVLAKECGHFDCSTLLLVEQHPPQPVAMVEVSSTLNVVFMKVSRLSQTVP